MPRVITTGLPLAFTLFTLNAIPAFADQPAQQNPSPTTQSTEQDKADDLAKDNVADKGVLPLDDLRTFADVFDRIKKAYVEDVDDKTLLENAIQGMLSELDPHSAYLKPEAFRDLQISTTGEFGGLGIEVGMENGYVKVISPIDDTPADKAGVMAGDLIIKLDETQIKGMSLGEAIKLMRGEIGEPIKLTIIRKGVQTPIEITVVRAAIQVQSVKRALLESGIGYVRLSQFQINTGKDMVKAIDKLTKENKGPLQGLVLDLRNNPGGVLQAAVDVTDAFVEKGLVVYTKGRVADAQMKFSATPGDKLDGKPVIVLINGGSASASEIVSGALQDHKRAIVMGTQSFGKGSVQTVLPLHNNRAVKITTARYYTPNGRSIQAKGIVPDIKVERAKLTKLGTNMYVKEAELTGHLENASEKKPKEQAKKDKPTTSAALEETDYQLYEAVNLLKALNVVGFRASPSKTSESTPEKSTLKK